MRATTEQSIWVQWSRGNFERVRKTIANSFLVKPLETSISFVAEKLLHHEKYHIEIFTTTKETI